MFRGFRRNVALGISIAVCGVLVAVPSAQAGQDQMPPDHFTTLNATINFGFEFEPIPADFFGPGSDPFTGSIVFGPSPSGLGDTRVQRAGPVDCPGAGFPRPCDPVAIEIVQLSLVGTNPIVVTFNGGQSPEEWLVSMGLSETQGQGVLNAELAQPNGGTLTLDLPVAPRLVFTQTGEFDRVFDFIDAGIGSISLGGGGPWAVNTNNGDVHSPSNGNFVPLVDPDTDAAVQAQLNSPGGDVVHIIIPGPPAPVPAVSTWGMAVMVLLVLTTASILLMRRRAIDVSS